MLCFTFAEVIVASHFGLKSEVWYLLSVEVTGALFFFQEEQLRGQSAELERRKTEVEKSIKELEEQVGDKDRGE